LPSIALIIFSFLLSTLCSFADSGAANHKEMQSLDLTFTFSTEDVSITKDGIYDRIKLSGGSINPQMQGYPELPEKIVKVLLPAGAEVVDVRAEASEILIGRDIYPYPLQPPRAVSATENPKWIEPVADAYSGSRILPDESAYLISGTQKMRGWCFAELKLCPLRYLAKKRELYLATEISVEVQYRLSDIREIAPKGNSEIFEKNVKRIVINPDQKDTRPVLGDNANIGNPDKILLKSTDSADVGIMAVNPPGEGAVDYLIITPQSLVTAFQPLANHRASFNGWDTQIVTKEFISTNYTGADIQMKIRNCIIDYVNNYGTTFVVLGGDDTLLPDRNCYIIIGSDATTDLPTDMYYAGLDGSWDQWNNNGVYGEADVGGVSTHDEFDIYADVYVGRIPVRTASQATAYVNKVINYDNNFNEDFAHRILMGGWEGWDLYEGSSRPAWTVCDGHIAFRDAMHPIVSDAEIWGREDYKDIICAANWPVTQVKMMFDTLNSWDNNGSGAATRVYSMPSSAVVNRLSEGWHIVHHFGHGSEYGTDIGGPINAGNAPQLYGMVNFWHTGACLTGGFDLREPCLSEAMIRNASGGCIVYMGNSRVNWSGIAQELNERFLEYVVEGQMPNIGELFYTHKLACRMDNPWERWTFYVMNLQGDPGVDVNLPSNIADVQADNEEAVEGGENGIFTITRNSTIKNLNVQYAITGTAVRGSDYVTEPDGNTLTIPAGSAFAQIQIIGIDDSNDESDKTVKLTLLDTAAYNVGPSMSAEIILFDDEPKGDFNHNGCVDINDLWRFAACWLSEDFNSPENLYYDLSVGFEDFAVFAENWLACGSMGLEIINIPDEAHIGIEMVGLPIVAKAVSTLGAVIKVEFFVDNIKIGEDTESSDGWSFNWQVLELGWHILRLRAEDSLGNIKYSPSISVLVVPAPPPS